MRRNPVLLVVAAAFSLLQLPGLLAQSLHPLVGSLVSLGFSGVSIFVMPFFFAGILAMANEALDGRTSARTFVREGKSHYVSVLVVYLGLFAVNLVLGFAIAFAAIFVGIFVLSGAGQPNLAVLAVLGGIGLLALVGYLLVAFLVQFFGHAIVVDDLNATESIKRSAWCVRHNLVSVLGYSLLTAAGGAVFGLFGGLLSLLTTPRPSPAMNGAAPPAAAPLPFDLPTVGLVGTVGLALLLVILTGAFGGLFAAFSTALYREIRPSAPSDSSQSIAG